MPATRPELAEVDADRIVQALHLLGCPTVLTAADGQARPAGRPDVPQLLGALTAAVELVAADHDVPTGDGPHQFAAGYLSTLRAGTGCGATEAFYLLTLRLQQTCALLQGWGVNAVLAEVTRRAANAAAGFATTLALAGGPGSTKDDRTSEASQQAAAKLHEATRELDTARSMVSHVYFQSVLNTVRKPK